MKITTESTIARYAAQKGKVKNMEWYQVATIVAANLGLFLWTVRQSRADYLQCQRTIDSIHAEMRDFHGRLCAIEERNRK